MRVRFAPSPTGFFHIGSARTALFNWLYARHTGGTFILRIEDTDKSRNTPEALECLLDGMRWLGMDWDEGPEKGGDYGPYFQSERQVVYDEYLQKLADAGRTYEKDGAIFLKLEGERYTEFDKHKNEEVEKVKTQPVVIEDAIRGRVERAEDRDFVLVRSDGSPGFHFVNVVDDIAMGITHVIRGEDHLSNTSKHVELYKAFGVTPPVFAHIPLILKEQGSGKMSKREKGALIEEYRTRQFLPEAVRNYLCLLGWSPKDDREILDIAEIISLFELHDITKNNARFDEKKLTFINAAFIKEMPEEELLAKSKTILEKHHLPIDEAYLRQVLAISKEKLSSLEQLEEFLRYFCGEDFPFSEESHERIFKKGEPLLALQSVLPVLQNLEPFDHDSIDQAFQQLAEREENKVSAYMPITRFAVSGFHMGPSFYDTLAVIGKEKCVARIERFLATHST